MIQVLKILTRSKACTYYERQRSGTIIPSNNYYDYKRNRIQPDEESNVYFLYVNLCSVIYLFFLNRLLKVFLLKYWEKKTQSSLLDIGSLTSSACVNW